MGLRTFLDHPGFSYDMGVLKTRNHRQKALQVGFHAIR